MAESGAEKSFQRAKEDALQSLTASQRQASNFYISRTTVAGGARIGPPFQQTIVEGNSILVFVDLQPGTGFGHLCRYLLYDAETGALRQSVDAQFPPFIAYEEELSSFHRPVSTTGRTDFYRLIPDLDCPPLFGNGERYAILFSGLTYPQYLNDLEFSYRTLVDRYGFNPGNVFVHLYDGTLATALGPAGTWPGDNTPFRMHVTGPGTRAALQQTLNVLKGRLGEDDLVFLHTENEATATPETALVEPGYALYRASDLAADISSLPRHESLIALMASCYSTGFSAGLLASSRAESTSVSCASAGNTAAHMPDWQFMKFSCDWLTAQMGHDPFGAPVTFNPDLDADGAVESEEAFWYAYSQRNPMDTATFGETSEEGGDISLSRRYEWWWWWCWLLLPTLKPYFERLPQPEFYARLNSVLPNLQTVLPAVDLASKRLRAEFGPSVEAILASAFGGSRL